MEKNKTNKKKTAITALITVAIIAVVAVVAFFIFNGNLDKNDNSMPNHVCEYTEQVVSDEYKKSDATCEDKAEYYYSCACGEKGTETFEHGTKLGHAYGEFKSNSNGTHSKVCANDNSHVITENCYGGTPTVQSKPICIVCGGKYGEKLPQTHTHNYNLLKSNENTHWYECSCGSMAQIESHFGGNATCTKKAVCELCNCEYGKLKSHNYTQLKFNETQHWYECVCGDKSGEENHLGGQATCTQKAVCEVCVQSYGDMLNHEYKSLKYDSEQHWYECDCGAFETKENHIPSAPATETTDQICTVCQKVLNPSLGHVHKLHLTKVTKTEPSCTKEGNREHYICSCGKMYWDDDAQNEITNPSDVALPKTPHNNNQLKYNENTHWYECDCGNKSGLQNHAGGQATCTQKAVCLTCNQEYGNKLNHEYNNLKYDQTQHWHECDCGAFETKENHFGGKATCTQKAVCEVCGQEYGNKLNHQYDNLKFDQTQHWYECDCGAYETKIDHFGGQATCTQKAVCSFCSQEYGNKLNHEYENLRFNETQHWYACDCGAFETKENHFGGQATCTQKAVCELCNQEYGSKLNHEYDNLNYDSTEHWYECDCGAYETKVNHFGGQATCTQKAVCELCNQEYGNKLNHGYDNLNYDSTMHWYECDCGKYITSQNHLGGEPTCKDRGVCSICGQIYGDLADHEYVDGQCKWCGELKPYSQGLEYRLINNDTEYRVSIGTCIEADIVIPATYNNKPVTQVYDFANCHFIKSVKLPDTIRYIMETAFSHCSSLKKINIPNGVEIIYDQAFWNCTSLTEISLPESVVKIYLEAFMGCTALKKVTLPAELDLDRGVFKNCSSLEQVVMPTHFRYDDYVSSELFYGCSMLKDIVIPNDVERICQKAFYGCNSLTAINLTNTLEIIEESAFDGCHHLKSLTIPENVTFIGLRAFANLYYLEQINYKAKNCADIYFANSSLKYDTPFRLDSAGVGSNKKLIIEQGVERIPNYLFSGANSSHAMCLKSVEIADSVTSIGKEAFAYCVFVSKELEISVKVTSIEDSAFLGCSTLEKIVIPFSVATIGAKVFDDCDNLTIYCAAESKPNGWSDNWNPDNRPVVWGYDAESKGLVFTLINNNTEYELSSAGTYADANVVIPSTYRNKPVTSIGESAFESKTLFTSVSIPASVRIIGENAFKGCSKLETISIAENSCLQEVESGAFDNCNYLLYTTFRTVKYVKVNDNQYYLLQSATEKGLSGYTLREETKFICGSAFSSCNSLSSVTIPSQVIGIGKKAFSSCDALKTITFASNNNLKLISEYAFYDCLALTQINIPDSVIRVDDFAFFSCDRLSSVTFGANSNLTYIGNSAFASCSIYSFIIPSKVEKLGNAFYNCNNLSRIEIPQSVSYIASGAFNNSNIVTVNYLGSIDDWVQIIFESNTANPLHNKGKLYINGVVVENVILSTATRVGNFAFYHYTSLISIEIAKTVNSIGENAFDGCTNLATVTFADNSQLSNISIFAFQGCKKLKSIILPNSVTTIDNYSFNSCSSLNTISLSSKTQTIGDYAFSGCAVSSITIPAQVQSIGANAFIMCMSLDSLTFAKNSKLVSIGNNAFAVTKLSKIIIPKNVTDMGSMVFSDCDNLTIYCEAESKPITWADNWNPANRPVVWGYIEASEGLSFVAIKGGTEYEVSSYGVCTDTEVVVPKTYQGKPVTSIGKDAFKSCTNVNSIYLPNSITNIGEYAFYKCSALTKIVLPTSVTNIEMHAFNNCTALQYTVKDGLNYLGDSANEYYCLIGPVDKTITTAVVDSNCKIILPRAFYSCASLTSVQLPNGLINIGKSAFGACSVLAQMEIPNSVTKIGADAFVNCPALPKTQKDGLMYIGNSTNKYLYLICYNTNTTATSVTIDENCKFIGSSAFSGWSALSSVRIPNSVISICDEAFYNCIKLESVQFSTNLLRIGERAFYKCAKITELTLPISLKEIGSLAFYDCKGLTKIEIPDSVEKIDVNAFYNCSKLKTVTIGSGVKYIGVCAFSDCDSLASITVSEQNVAYKSIDGNLYSKDGKIFMQYAIGNKLTSFTIPNHVTTICTYAFSRAYNVSVIIPTSVTVVEGMAFYGGSSVKIYCRASSKPSGWDNYWNYSSWPTTWGYTG